MHRSVVVTSVAGDEQRLLEGEGLEMEGKASVCCSQVPGAPGTDPAQESHQRLQTGRDPWPGRG